MFRPGFREGDLAPTLASLPIDRGATFFEFGADYSRARAFADGGDPGASPGGYLVRGLSAAPAAIGPRDGGCGDGDGDGGAAGRARGRIGLRAVGSPARSQTRAHAPPSAPPSPPGGCELLVASEAQGGGHLARRLPVWAEMSSTLPERYLPAHSAYALAMYVLGCRGEDPAQFDYSRHAASLSMEDPVEASLWRLWWARSGRCGWRGGLTVSRRLSRHSGVVKAPCGRSSGSRWPFGRPLVVCRSHHLPKAHALGR